jgi:hypothetical protein
MTNVTYVVKQQGKRPTEAFDPAKIQASIMAVCLSVRTPEGQAEATATTVCDAVVRWLADKPEVTSDDIRRKAADVLAKYHPEAAHLYKHHHKVI